MEIDIKCDKCGHVNKAEPESQCVRCGEYLYQFHMRKVRRAKYIKMAIASGIVLVFIAVLLIQLTVPANRAVSQPPLQQNSVRQDLVNYLKQIAAAR